MRLKIHNLMYKASEDEYYSLIDLNHIFGEDDILDPWDKRAKGTYLPDDDLGWLKMRTLLLVTRKRKVVIMPDNKYDISDLVANARL